MSESPATSIPVVPERSPTQAPSGRARAPSTLLLAAVVVIFGGGVLLTGLTSDVTKESEPGVKLVDGHPFLTDKVGDWTGGELQGLGEEERRLLPADTEGARRLYTDANHDELFCSVVLAGRDVASIHRPELCLPGQGWKIENEYTEPIRTAAAPGGVLHVMRMNATRSVVLENGQTDRIRTIFLYWFVGKNRVTPYHWQRIFWTACDRVFHNTNHRWAYIMITAVVGDETAQGGLGKSSEQEMAIASRFVQDIYPTLIEPGGG
ncbi:MAG TPA: exosortase-associated EpsI family protein [Verrucomicrobiae bacterium]|nr:exosortase-associated EpsI family protein [Verrucomicrobiae bacterium]